MGLITQIESLNGTLNKNERNKLEREKRKALEQKLTTQSKDLLLFEMLDYIEENENAFIIYQEETKDLLISKVIQNLKKCWASLQDRTTNNIIDFLNITYYTHANKAKTIYKNKQKYKELENIKAKVKEEQARQEFYNISNIKNVLEKIPNYKIKQK